VTFTQVQFSHEIGNQKATLLHYELVNVI